MQSEVETFDSPFADENILLLYEKVNSEIEITVMSYPMVHL